MHSSFRGPLDPDWTSRGLLCRRLLNLSSRTRAGPLLKRFLWFVVPQHPERALCTQMPASYSMYMLKGGGISHWVYGQINQCDWFIRYNSASSLPTKWWDLVQPPGLCMVSQSAAIIGIAIRAHAMNSTRDFNIVGPRPPKFITSRLGDTWSSTRAPFGSNTPVPIVASCPLRLSFHSPRAIDKRL